MGGNSTIGRTDSKVINNNTNYGQNDDVKAAPGETTAPIKKSMRHSSFASSSSSEAARTTAEQKLRIYAEMGEKRAQLKGELANLQSAAQTHEKADKEAVKNCINGNDVRGRLQQYARAKEDAMVTVNRIASEDQDKHSGVSDNAYKMAVIKSFRSVLLHQRKEMMPRDNKVYRGEGNYTSPAFKDKIKTHRIDKAAQEAKAAQKAKAAQEAKAAQAALKVKRDVETAPVEKDGDSGPMESTNSYISSQESGTSRTSRTSQVSQESQESHVDAKSYGFVGHAVIPSEELGSTLIDMLDSQCRKLDGIREGLAIKSRLSEVEEKYQKVFGQEIERTPINEIEKEARDVCQKHSFEQIVNEAIKQAVKRNSTSHQNQKQLELLRLDRNKSLEISFGAVVQLFDAHISRPGESDSSPREKLQSQHKQLLLRQAIRQMILDEFKAQVRDIVDTAPFRENHQAKFRDVLTQVKVLKGD